MRILNTHFLPPSLTSLPDEAQYGQHFTFPDHYSSTNWGLASFFTYLPGRGAMILGFKSLWPAWTQFHKDSFIKIQKLIIFVGTKAGLNWVHNIINRFWTLETFIMLKIPHHLLNTLGLMECQSMTQRKIHSKRKIFLVGKSLHVDTCATVNEIFCTCVNCLFPHCVHTLGRVCSATDVFMRVVSCFFERM